MKIHLYTTCWNEEKMLDFFFRHYDSWIDRYIIFDDSSTDNTLSILRKHPKVEIRIPPRLVKDSYVLSNQIIYNSCWKESRGQVDWIVITAVDEHLYHPSIKSYLQQCAKKGITAIPTLGYQMISDNFPKRIKTLCETIVQGAPFAAMDKLNIFNPNAIEEINYVVGRHEAAPTGNIVYPKKNELLNLHYKYLSFAYVLERHKQLDDNRGSKDKENKFGFEYAFPEEKLCDEWRSFEQNAVNVMLPSSLILRQQLHDKDEQIKNMYKTILAKDSQIKNLDLRVANFDKIIADKNSHIDNILNSSSWKITAPLRFIKRKIIRLMLLLRRLILIKG